MAAGEGDSPPAMGQPRLRSRQEVYAGLPKALASILIQIRTEKIGLGQYLQNPSEKKRFL